MAGEFRHVELTTKDTAKSRSSTAGCLARLLRQGYGSARNFTMITTPSGPDGGMILLPGVPVAWTTCVAVDEIKAATEKAMSVGAETIREHVEVQNVGRFSRMKDPTGAVISNGAEKIAEQNVVAGPHANLREPKQVQRIADVFCTRGEAGGRELD